MGERWVSGDGREVHLAQLYAVEAAPFGLVIPFSHNYDDIWAVCVWGGGDIVSYSKGESKM